MMSSQPNPEFDRDEVLVCIVLAVCSIETPSFLQEQAFSSTVFPWAATRGWNMRKLSLALPPLATIAVAAPTIASAEEFGVGVRIGGDRDRDRGEFRGHEEFRG